MRETLGAGGHACHPLVAARGLSLSFIDPALAFLAAHDGQTRLGERLEAVRFDATRAVALEFGGATQPLGDEDSVVIATPPSTAQDLIPGLAAPDDFRAVVNAHFRIAAPPAQPAILGVVNGLVEWLFAYPDRLSVTISGADRLIERPREELAVAIWREVSALTGLPAEPLPPWRIVKEKRATFAATPEQNRKRPPSRTRFDNVALAGDWTATGLPATIEGAVRSGYRAAAILLEPTQRRRYFAA